MMKLLFLIIVLDDVSFEFLPGNIYTPNINKLRENGAFIEDTWSMPSCSPTRASILTGKYNTGVGYRVHPSRPWELFNSKLRLLPERLSGKKAHIGKWHVTHTIPKEYNYFSGTIEGSVGSYYKWYKNVNGKVKKINKYHTTELVDDSIKWLRKNDHGFLWLALSAPHDPLHYPPEHLIKNSHNRYTAMLEATDTELGRLFENIDMSSTYVFLLSDNGTPGRNREGIYRSLKGKGTLYQGGIHVPMIVSGPSIPQNSTVKGMVHVKDIYNTVLELHDGKIRKNSFKNSLFNPSIPTSRRYNFSHIYNSNLGLDGKTIRNHRYKLIKYRRKEFYDLVNDPMERVNLLKIPMSEEVKQEYKRLSRWLRKLP